MESEKKYHLKWMVERGEWTRDELVDAGGCDAMVLVSILRGPHPHQGEKSIAILHLDGYTTDEPPSTELFQVFAHFAAQLSEDEELPAWQRAIAAQAIDRIRMDMQIHRRRR